MTNSAEQRAVELHDLEARRVTLTREIETSTKALDEARVALATVVDSESIERATAAQSRVAALQGALAALDTQIADKGAELEAARRDEQRAANARRLEQIVLERQSAEDRFHLARLEACEALERQASVMESAEREFEELTSEARRLLRDNGESETGHAALSYFNAAMPEHKFAPAVRVANNIASYDNRLSFMSDNALRLEGRELRESARQAEREKRSATA